LEFLSCRTVIILLGPLEAWSLTKAKQKKKKKKNQYQKTENRKQKTENKKQKKQ